MASDQQQRAIECAVHGRSIVLAGAAGTGKSYVISRICSEMHDRKVAVTAMTGQAAGLLDGQTLHSVLGLPVQFGLAAADLQEQLRYDPTLTAREQNELFQACVAAAVEHTMCGMDSDKINTLRSLDVLVIDEVSMLSRFLFEVADQLFRRVMSANVPFGGKQLIAVGDMLQLPPVGGRNIGTDDILSQPFYASASLFLNLFDERVFVLTTNYRQQDPVFQQLLSRVACGRATYADIELIRSREAHDIPDDVIRILSRNADVDAHNGKMLANLVATTGCIVHTYKRMIDVRPIGNPSRARLVMATSRANTDCGVPLEVKVCTGARVMLTSNHPACELYNGTMGIVVGFTGDDCPQFVSEANYDRYMAREPCTDAELQKIRPTMSQDEIDYILTRVYTVRPVAKTTTDYHVADISVTQIPLRLVWAITAHKAQGLQAERIAASLTRDSCFGPGMTYTIMSRVASLQGFFLTDKFDPVVLARVDQRAVAFYDRYRP